MNNTEEKIDLLTQNIDKLVGAVSKLTDTVDELAVTTKQGFDAVGKETAEIKSRIDGLVHRFEFDALERRVVDLELKQRQQAA
jgi:hypothetical protein